MVKYLISAVLVVISIYGLRVAWPLIAGPNLSISSPLNYGVFQDGIVPIEGVAMRADRAVLNGNPIFRKEDGHFSLTLSFPRGSSILTFVAADRFGRRITETRSIFVP